MLSRKDSILVVDDQPTNLMVLFSFLQTHNFQIHIADSGRRALNILTKICPDIILLDVMMPELDGFATCRRIKEDKKMTAIPVVFMTALDSVEDKVAGFAAGGVDYITKPFQQIEVLARIRTHIMLRKREVELEHALSEIKTLTGILPICSYCKQIRNDKGYWQQVEEYICEHSGAMFSHGLCPNCYKKEMANFVELVEKNRSHLQIKLIMTADSDNEERTSR